MNQIQTLQNILNALMTINVKGNDTITLGSCLQALDKVISNMKIEQQKVQTEVSNTEQE